MAIDVPARLGDPEVREFAHFRRVATRDPLARLAGVPFLPLRYFPQQFTSPDLSADNAGERWAEDILAGFERVARLAFSEHEPPGDGIAAARGARAWCRRRLCARL